MSVFLNAIDRQVFILSGRLLYPKSEKKTAEWLHENSIIYQLKGFITSKIKLKPCVKFHFWQNFCKRLDVQTISLVMKTSKHPNLSRIKLLTLIVMSITLGLSIQSNAQSVSKNTLMQMIEKDRTTIDAIAGCDEKVQSHILKVAQTPELLNKIEELQKRSQNQFRGIIANYDQETQGAFYEMARYPNLITDLVSNGEPSTYQVSRIVLNYPEDIRETTNKYAPRYFDALQRIDRLNNEIDKAFKYSLEPYDPQTRESVNVLIGYPEIVSVLIEDKAFTLLLGEVYREDPEWVVRRLDRISQELVVQNKEDLDAYKNQIQNDPEAYNEMLQASEKFASENNEVRYLERSSDPTVEVRVINNYPYWYGYPYWYSTPYWRPQPFYYHTGFYRNNFGNVVFVGLPSYQFIHWQTNYHPTLFPHLSYNYYSYYDNRYTNRYRDSHRPVPHYGFYRSIESNVINNPRVNNSSLEQIDHQKGKSIVRKPNTMESSVTRRGNTSITRQGETSNSRQGTSGTVNRRGTETMNQNGNGPKSPGTTRGSVNNSGTNRNNTGTTTTGGAVNRREYNTVNPGRSEGPLNRRGSETGSGSIRREANHVTTSPVQTPAERSRQGTSINGSNNENSRSKEVNTNNNTIPTKPQLRNETQAPAVRSERVESMRETSPVVKPSAQERRETPATTVRTSGRSAQPAQREAKAVNSQSSTRKAASEKRSSSPAVSSEKPEAKKGTRRQQ